MLVRASYRHPYASLKQRTKLSGSYTSYSHGYTGSGTRHYTTKVRNGKAASYGDRSRFASNTFVGGAIHRSSGRTPFASTLRPNLTGGTLNRTSGGYAFGAGSAGRSARYFSSSPAAPAEVVHSVTQAMRAFVLSGQKAQFNGVDPRTGEKKFRAISALQEETSRKMNGLPKTAPGSYAHFNINPTVTGLTTLGSVNDNVSFVEQQTLCEDGLLDVLSIDFSRSLKELAAVLNDLQKLSALGDLPITYRKTALRVHFPGCDSTCVENLCTELGVQRAIVKQDDDFAEIGAAAGGAAAGSAMSADIGLHFPLAPVGYENALEVGNHLVNTTNNFNENMILTQNAPRDRIEWQDMVGPVTRISQHPSKQDETADAVSSAMTVTGSMLDDISNIDVNANDVYHHRTGHLSSPSGYDTLHSSELDDIPIMPPHSQQRNKTGIISPNNQLDEDTHPHPDPVADYQGFEGIYRFIEQCDSAVRR